MSKINDLIKKLCPNGVEYKKLKEISVMQRGQSITIKDLEEGDIPVIAGGQTPSFYNNKYNRDGETITVSSSGAYAGFLNYWNVPILCTDSFTIKSKNVNMRFLYHYLKMNQNEIYNKKKGAGIPHVHISDIENFRMPVPPMEIQEEIIRILDKFGELEVELEAELEARKSQYEFWRGKLLNNKKYESVKINDIAYNVSSGKCNSRNEDGFYPVYGSTGIIAKTDEYLYETEKILIARVGANAGYVHIANGKYNVTDNTLILDLKDNVDLRFMYYYLQNYNLNKLAKGGGQPLITGGQIKDLDICLPPIQEQKRISNILDKFDKLINDISEGIPSEIEFRRKQYEYYRNMLLSFEEVS